MWKDAYLQDRRLSSGIFPKLAPQTHQKCACSNSPHKLIERVHAQTCPTNSSNVCMLKLAPQTNRTCACSNAPHKLTEVCMLKLAPNSPLSEITSFELGNKAGFMEIETVRQVAEANVPVPTASPFMFELAAEAAAHNTSILESFDYDLDMAIGNHPGTAISPGSELRPPEQHEPPPPDLTERRHTVQIHLRPNRGIKAHRPARQPRQGDALDRVFNTDCAWRFTSAPGPERTYRAGQFFFAIRSREYTSVRTKDETL